MKLTLTRAQRKALFAGEHPRITVSKTWAEEWRAGFEHPEIKLSAKVGIKVSGIHEADDGVFVALYVLCDDRPRLLRARTRSAGYEEGLRDDLTGAELAKASEASAYTHSPGAALRGSAEEVSRTEQGRFAKESASPALQLLRNHRAEVKGTLDRIRANPLLHGRGTFSAELQSAEIRIEKVLSKCEARINGEARRVA